ncbi:uncharacterized protein EAE98_011201 [Botrytis deweyae]|uniref:Pinin/SDK/MemA protein domain-containing protein n=1 Tax=Botrytis deweyae TaxID=2478750 RepID=A0ABQ7I6L7_9HELO|nr:uncharacterized protein EAE98_011201 [Botrytis deweyae]KAF7915335.1 hypothetical protein EAE98_011201 [Botrytis deweyae]
MFSKLRSKLSRVLSPDKKEGTIYQKVNDAEKEAQSNRNDETKKNTYQSSRERNRSIDSLERTRCLLNLMRHNVNDAEKEVQSNRNDETKTNTQQSPKKRDTYVNSPERTRCLLNLLRHDPRNDNLPPYSSTQTSRPSSGLPSQQKPSIKGKEIKNDRPPPYGLPENMSSASRRQYIRGLIDRRKAEIQTLEQQLEEETGKARPSSTGTTLRVGESSSIHVTLQREAAQEETGEEGIPSTVSSSQTKGTMQDMEYYIQYYIPDCKYRGALARNMKRLQELKNETNLAKKERERSSLEHDLSVGGDTLIYWCGQRK